MCRVSFKAVLDGRWDTPGLEARPRRWTHVTGAENMVGTRGVGAWRGDVMERGGFWGLVGRWAVGGCLWWGRGAWAPESAILFVLMACAVRVLFKKHFPLSGSSSFPIAFPLIRPVTPPSTFRPLVHLASTSRCAIRWGNPASFRTQEEPVCSAPNSKYPNARGTIGELSILSHYFRGLFPSQCHTVSFL